MNLLEKLLKKFLDLKKTTTKKTVEIEKNDPTNFLKTRREYFNDVTPPALQKLHLKNSRILTSREAILHEVPKGGIIIEVGTQFGEFAKKIIEICQPEKLYILDISYHLFDFEYFQPLIANGKIEILEGDSSTLLSKFENNFFDMIYIDGDHSYEGSRKDLYQAVLKIKKDGLILCNDYTIYSPFEECKYGVSKSVNEICIEKNYEILYLGLHTLGYHDVALRKI